jgi:hypothetical protein
MNWKRGLFRAWLVLAGIWVVGSVSILWERIFPSSITTVYYSAVENRVSASHRDFPETGDFAKGNFMHMDLPDNQVRIFFSTAADGVSMPVTKEELKEHEKNCEREKGVPWCRFTPLTSPLHYQAVKKHPEYNGIVGRAEFVRRQERLDGLYVLLGAGLLPPIAALAFGWLCLWVISGFRRDRT